MSKFRREDKFPLPAFRSKRWEWAPTNSRNNSNRLVVMKDFALAATNSIEEVWGKKNVLVGTCAYHASSRWLDTAGKSHVRKKENLKLIMADFQFARDCPYVSLVPIVVDAMVSKWKKVYKEDTLADSW